MPTAEKKLARKRPSVAELPQRLSNVSEACRRRGISRTRFYEQGGRSQTHGLENLVDLPPVRKWHPQAAPQETAERILEWPMTHVLCGAATGSQTSLR